MLHELSSSPLVAYIISGALGAGAGLSFWNESRRSRLGFFVTTITFVALAFVFFQNAVWSALIYAVITIAMSIAHAVSRHSDDPLLQGEPYAKRVALVVMHGERLTNTKTRQGG